MKKLYKFYWDCGRSGDLEGLFIADSDVIDELIGEEIYFGEVLGKHSEIYGKIEADDIEVISEDFKVIEVFEAHRISSGYNPVEYYLESIEEKLEYPDDLEPEELEKYKKIYEKITGKTYKSEVM